MNIALAIGLAYLFARKITSRLQVMIDNTHRLVQKQPLLPEQAGQDEIAYLDTQFHTMSRTLADLEDLRRSMVSMYSHDMRTPLSSVQATLALLRVGRFGELSERGTTSVLKGERACDEVIRLANNMLDFEKLDLGKVDFIVEETRIDELILSALDDMAGIIESKHITIETDLTPSTIPADRGWIKQVVYNLLTNAVKFSPEQSSIKIAGTIFGDIYRVSIADSGPGIAAEDQQRIFQRYEQAKSRDRRIRGGYGIGLAVCQSVVTAHDGRIGLESDGENGSTFWFELPLKRASNP